MNQQIANIHSDFDAGGHSIIVHRSPRQKKLSKMEFSLVADGVSEVSSLVDEVRESLIEGLKLAMAETGINGIDLAKMSGHSRQYIYKILKNNQSSVTIDKILELTAYVGCSTQISVRVPK